MLFDTLNLVEGSRIINLTIDTGTAFPGTPSSGELFYRTDVPSLFVYDGTSWSQIASGSGSFNVTGDVLGTLSGGSGALVLVNTGIAAGPYGSASSTLNITTDLKGRITAIAATPIAIGANQLTSGTLADARVAASNITQHQASLVILESQITDGAILARVAGNETISGTWSFTTPVSVGTPSSGAHAVTKDYLDSAISGASSMRTALLATTVNIALTGLQTVDGTVTTAGDRVLVKNQGTGTNNGIYVVAAGTWTRATDYDGTPGIEVKTGDLVYIESGTLNGKTTWVQTSSAPVIGTTALAFELFTRNGDIVAGSGLTRSGGVIDVGTASLARIVINPDNIDLATVGTAGTYTSITTDAYGRVTAGTNPANVSSFNTRTGAVVLTSADITTALGYTPGSGGGSVTSISVAAANGVSATITNPTTTPDLTFTLGAITPASVVSTGSVTGSNLTGTNTGDQTIALTGDVSGMGTGTFAVTLATVANSGTGTFLKLTRNNKGLVSGTTAVVAADITTLVDTSYVKILGDTMTGDLVISKAAPKFSLNGTTNSAEARIDFAYNALSRWSVGKNAVTEAGANSGSDFAIKRFNDAGVLIDTPITIGRSTGIVDFLHSPTAPTPTASSQVSTKGYTDSVVSAVAGSGLPITIITGSSQAASAANHYVLSNASPITLTLPASPAVSSIVWVTNVTTGVTHIINRNGSNIMGLAEDLIFDVANVTAQFCYVDATNGWRII